MVLLPSLNLHHCQHCTGIVALVAPALLSLFHSLISLPSRCVGIITNVAPALLPPLSWRVCTVALVSSPLPHWHCCPGCAGISTLIAQASLPLLCLCRAVDSQASLPVLSWHVLSRRRCGRPRRRQLQHQRNKGNNASMTRAAMPANKPMMPEQRG